MGVRAHPLSYQRRPERHRWLRSDGTPNFSDRIYRKTEDMEIIAKKPVETVSSSTPLLGALEKMARGYRCLAVVKAGDLFEGLLVQMDLIDYLGGGRKYNIVMYRHGNSLYKALEHEPVSTLMNRNPIVAYIDEKFPSVLEKIVVYEIGVLPVLTRDGRVYGIITERDILDYLAATTSVGVKARDVMSSPVITVPIDSSLKDVMETMVRFGFRRIPVVKDNYVEGIVTAMDIIKFFGSHRVFKYTTTGLLTEIHRVPVTDVMVRDVVTVTPDTDVGDIARVMEEKGVGSVLVVGENNELLGIVSERDVLYAIAAK